MAISLVEFTVYTVSDESQVWKVWFSVLIDLVSNDILFLTKITIVSELSDTHNFIASCKFQISIFGLKIVEIYIYDALTLSVLIIMFEDFKQLK